MVGSQMVSRGAGPPDSKLDPSGRIEGARVLHLDLGFTVAKGQTWQIALAIILVLLTSTAAYNEEYSTASYQTVPGTSPDFLDSLPFHNSTERLPQAEQDLQSPSTESRLDSHSVGENLYTRLATSIGTAGQSPIASTQWNLSKVSGSIELKLGGQGSLSGDSLDLQSSTGLTLATSPSAGALATTTGVSLKLSSKEFQQLEINTLPSSLPLHVLGAEIMEHAHTVDAHPMHFLTSPSITSSYLHVDWNMTHQTGSAQETSLSTVPATEQPPSATILTLDTSSPSEHITGIEQGVHGTRLSSAKTVHGVDVDQLHGDHNGTVLSAETLGYWDRLKEPPYLQSSGSPEADLTNLMRTTAPRTIDTGMKHFTSSHGATARSYLVSMLHTYASILSVPPPTKSFDASSETTSSQLISVVNGQELDITEPPAREPLSQSSFWPSSGQFEAPTRVTLVKSPGFTDSRKTKESSTHRLLETLSVGKSSWHTPVPVTESPNISNASAGNELHISAENYTEASLRKVFHYGESLTTVPSNLGLSSVGAPTSSSSLPAVEESTVRGSQWSETSSGLPSRNASLPMIVHSPKSSTDMANVGVGQLAVATATYVPRSFAAGMPGFGPSRASTVLELDTGAVGTHTEASLFVGHQSSVSTKQTADSDLTSLSMLPSYLGSAKEQEDSPATEIIPSTFTVQSKLELKEGSLVAREYTTPSEASSQAAVSSDTDRTNFLSMQTSSHPPRYSRGGTEYLHSWAPSAVLETSSLEGMTTAHQSKWIKTELHEREAQTQAAAQVMSTIFSELPLKASEGIPVTELSPSFTSAKPEAQSTHEHDVLPRQGSEATQLPPRDSTYLTVSKQPSELKVFSLAKKSSSTSTVHTPTAGSPPLPSYPYLGTAEITNPVGIAPAGTEYAGLVTGHSTDGVPVKPFGTTPSEWKVAVPTPAHATAASANITEAGRSSVAPTYRSVSPGFTRGNVSESTLPYLEATKGLMARREWMVPASTMLSGTSNTKVQRSDLRTSTAANTTHERAPYLSTGALKVVTSTSAMTTEAVLGYKATGAFTEAVGTTTALPVLPPTQAVPASTIHTVSGTLSTASRSMSSTIPASLTPLQSTSAWLPTSEPLLARKITTLRSMDTKNTSAVSSAKVPSPQETNTTVLITSTKSTEDVHTSKQLGPMFESQTLSQSTERDSLTLSSRTSRIIAVHALPLQFRLTRINYTESLENKSSDSYKKLEKEVKLTLNKMLSRYGNFLHSNIFHFLNGSVTVESEAVFQGEGLIPTPSDVIRTIVTEIERRKMDTFFDWRVDPKSLRSNGLSLENLEPEVLTVSFTLLGLGSTAVFGGMTDREPLERLTNEVILLLGTRYQVQDFVLDQVGNSQGDLDITGKAYINTHIHVDINWVLEALRGLVNYSMDLSSLSVNGSRLGLQVFPFSFLVTNREVNKELLDRSSLEHKTLAKDLSDVLMRILRQYKNFLQVTIREITGGSLMCHGNVIFQHPAPSSKDVLQTLARAIGPKDYLAASSLQVDPLSFTVAGDGLEPPLTNLGVPGYGVALMVLCALALIAVPVLNLLPKILGRKDKIIITRASDPEAGVETFELDNPGFHFTVEENHGHDKCVQKL